MAIRFVGAIYHDPESFAAPETFNPDRFLESEFGTVKGADNTGRKSDMMFGCGRVCSLLQSSLYVLSRLMTRYYCHSVCAQAWNLLSIQLYVLQLSRLSALNAHGACRKSIL